MTKRVLIFFWIICLCLLNNSCIKTGDFDFDGDGNLGFTYDLAFPLVDQHLTLGELLPDFRGQYVISGPDGLLRIVYREDFLFDFSYLGFFIPNIDRFETLFVPLAFPQDSLQLSASFETQLNIGEVRINSARTDSMDFTFQIHTGIQNDFRIDMTAHDIVDAYGRPFTASINNENRTIKSDLSGYSINPQPGNALRFGYTLTVFKDTLATEGSTGHVNIEVGFRNIEIDYAFGYFGQQTLNVSPGGTDLSIFERFPMDLLEIEQANMQIMVTNGFGIPISLDAQISTLTPTSPPTTLLINERLGHPQNLLAPPVSTIFQREIQDLINDNLGNLPHRVEYSATLTLNPDNDPTQQNFVSSNSFVRVEAGVEIPMRLRVGGLVVSDTIEFAGLPFPDGIQLFLIRANIHNAFPIDATVHIHLLDAQYQIIDSIWTTRPGEIGRKPFEIEGAPVNSAGHVIRPEVAQLEIPLSRGQIENLEKTRHIKIKGILNTSDHERNMISIFENSANEGFLRVMIGVRIRATGIF